MVCKRRNIRHDAEGISFFLFVAGVAKNRQRLFAEPVAFRRTHVIHPNLRQRAKGASEGGSVSGLLADGNSAAVTGRCSIRIALLPMDASFVDQKPGDG